MIRESLILGTLWCVLCRVWTALSHTALARGFDRFCRVVGALWRESLIVNWFCSPRCLSAGPRDPGRLRARCCALYRRLRLDALLEGSIFLRCAFWCALPAAVAPFAPTMGVVALSLVAVASLTLALLHERDRRLTPDPLALPMGVYAAAYLIGTLHSMDLRGSLPVTLVTFAFLFYSLALYHALDTRRQLGLLLSVMVTVGALVSAYGVLQYFFRFGYQSAAWVDADMFTGISFRVGATMENPNMLGQYLTLTIPLGGAKLLGERDGKRRAYWFVCCALMCVCMLLTFSRGAWLGLLFAGALFFVALEPRLLALAPVALAVLYVALPDTVVERFTSIGNMNDRSTSYRVSIWMGTLAMLRDGHWLLGVGPGEAAFNAVYVFYSYSASIAHHSHNLFLQIVCDAGIAALLAFLWLLLRCFRVLGAALLRGGQDRAARLTQIAFASGTLGFLVQAMTDYSFYNYRVMLLFWAYLALGMAAARRDGSGEVAA